MFLKNLRFFSSSKQTKFSPDANQDINCVRPYSMSLVVFSKLSRMVCRFYFLGPPILPTGDIEQFTPPLSNYPGQNRVEIAGSLKLRAFWGADSPKPILKLFSVKIVVSSQNDKRKNC